MSTPDTQNPPTPAAAAPAPEPAPVAPAAPATGPDGQPWDPQRQQDLITKLRGEVSGLEAKLKKAETDLASANAEIETYRQAQETEAQRIERERAEAEERAAQATEMAANATAVLRKGNLLAELSKPEHGIVDVQAAVALIQGVEYDDQGQPVNLTTSEGETPSLLDTFLAEKPYLKAQGTPAPAPTPPNLNGGGGGQQIPGPSLTPEELAAAKQFGMTPERYAAMRDARTVDDVAALNQT